MRKPMVTRTITSTKVTALCVNPQTEETFEKVFTITGKIEDKTKVLKTVTKQFNDETTAIVVVKEFSFIEALYGMSEADFIAGATILDPAKRKPIKADTKTTETTDAE